MHTFLFFLVICAGFGLISANISSSTIESDVNEIMKLSKDYNQYLPKIAHQLTKTTCQMVSQCCPQIQSTFISMSLLGKTSELVEQCFGSKASAKYLSNLLSCSPVMKLTTLVLDPQLIKYASILQKGSTQSKGNDQLIIDSCTSEELYSIGCHENNIDLEKACQRRVLENLAKQGDETYQTKIQQTKERYTQLISDMKKEFNN